MTTEIIEVVGDWTDENGGCYVGMRVVPVVHRKWYQKVGFWITTRIFRRDDGVRYVVGHDFGTGTITTSRKPATSVW